MPLKMPDGTDATELDGIIVLARWAQYLTEKGEKLILAGMGHPTFPANLDVCIGAKDYWERARNVSKQLEALDKLDENAIEKFIALSRNKPAEGQIHAALSRIKQIFIPDRQKSEALMAEGLNQFCAQFDDEVKENLKIKPQNVIFTIGGASGLHNIFNVLRREDQAAYIATPVPYYTLYAGQKGEKRNKLYPIPVMQADNYHLTPEALDTALQQAKTANQKIGSILLCNPNNPTGTVINYKTWDGITTILNKPENRHCWLVIDEAYDELIYVDKDEPAKEMQKISFLKFLAIKFNQDKLLPAEREKYLNIRNRLFCLQSATKAYSMAGERMAAVVGFNDALMAKLAEQITASGSAPDSLKTAYAYAISRKTDLQAERNFAMLRMFYKQQIDYAYEKSKKLGIHMPNPNYKVEAGIFLLIDLHTLIGYAIEPEIAKILQKKVGLPLQNEKLETDRDIAYYLLFKKGLNIIPLSALGIDDKKGWLRVTCTAGIETLDIIFDRLSEVLEAVKTQLGSQITLPHSMNAALTGIVLPTAPLPTGHFRRISSMGLLGEINARTSPVSPIDEDMQELHNDIEALTLSNILPSIPQSPPPRQESALKIMAAVKDKDNDSLSFSHEIFSNTVHDYWVGNSDNSGQALEPYHKFCKGVDMHLESIVLKLVHELLKDPHKPDDISVLFCQSFGVQTEKINDSIYESLKENVEFMVDYLSNPSSESIRVPWQVAIAMRKSLFLKGCSSSSSMKNDRYIRGIIVNYLESLENDQKKKIIDQCPITQREIIAELVFKKIYYEAMAGFNSTCCSMIRKWYSIKMKDFDRLPWIKNIIENPASIDYGDIKGDFPDREKVSQALNIWYENNPEEIAPDNVMFVGCDVEIMLHNTFQGRIFHSAKEYDVIGFKKCLQEVPAEFYKHPMVFWCKNVQINDASEASTIRDKLQAFVQENSQGFIVVDERYVEENIIPYPLGKNLLLGKKSLFKLMQQSESLRKKVVLIRSAVGPFSSERERISLFVTFDKTIGSMIFETSLNMHVHPPRSLQHAYAETLLSFVQQLTRGESEKDEWIQYMKRVQKLNLLKPWIAENKKQLEQKRAPLDLERCPSENDAPMDYGMPLSPKLYDQYTDLTKLVQLIVNSTHQQTKKPSPILRSLKLRSQSSPGFSSSTILAVNEALLSIDENMQNNREGPN